MALSHKFKSKKDRDSVGGVGAGVHSLATLAGSLCTQQAVTSTTSPLESCRAPTTMVKAWCGLSGRSHKPEGRRRRGGAVDSTRGPPFLS